MTESHTSPSNLGEYRICFYGAGSMAEAIVRGIINKNLIKAKQISMLNRSNEERLAFLQKEYGVQTVLEGLTQEQLLSEADIIVLAMKPKDAAAALKALKPILSSNHLIVSVIAGLSIESIKQLTNENQPVIRAMPNTSSTIGLGATGISCSADTSSSQRNAMEAVFQSIGQCIVVDEELQPAITGVSGSGPAYVYRFMEAMISGAQSLGLSYEEAKQLVAQTVLGAAEMVRITNENPAELRRKVTSPNGTTEAALHVLNEFQFAEAIEAAVKRSAERSIELGADIERSISQ